MHNKNVIEINGKFYDAVSGKMVEPLVTPSEVRTTLGRPARPAEPGSARSVHARAQQYVKPPVLDLRRKAPGKVPLKPVAQHSAIPSLHMDIARATPSKAQQQHHKLAPTLTAERSHARPVQVHTAQSPKGVHNVAPRSMHRTRQHSTALMRKVVTKPAPGLKRQINVQTPLQNAVPSLIVKKTSVYKVTPSRVTRAEAVHQSKQISRFEHPKSHSIPVSVAPIPVQPAPTATPTIGGAPNPTPSNRPLDMFERAIENASHYVDVKKHTRAFRRKRRQQFVSIAAASMALFVIAGFALYQNTPGLQFKVASVRAGVATAMPDLNATGFAYNGVSTKNGKVTLGLKTGGTIAQLSQEQTNWSNDDLLRQSNVGVDASGQLDYQSIKAGDTAVYRFNDTSATWIKNGVWYQLSSPDTLTNEQVESLARNS